MSFYFVGVLDLINKEIVEIRRINEGIYEYISRYKRLEQSGFSRRVKEEWGNKEIIDIRLADIFNLGKKMQET